MRIESHHIVSRPITNAIADPPKPDLTPPPVPQDVQNGSLPENYNYTDFIWMQLYLNSQFPPRQGDQPAPQE